MFLEVIHKIYGFILYIHTCSPDWSLSWLGKGVYVFYSCVILIPHYNCIEVFTRLNNWFHCVLPGVCVFFCITAIQTPNVVASEAMAGRFPNGVQEMFMEVQMYI